MTSPMAPDESGDLPLPPDEGGGFFGAGPEAGAAGDTPVDTVAPRGSPYRVLARKYRPLNFDDLIGQDATIRILRRAFQLGRVAHAFMLTGVRGVGKTTTARIIARALNCIGTDGKGGPTADPCGVCANCTAILADRHPDVLEMDAASRTGVDDIREIIEATRFRPMQARMKVFIIDEVHMLSRNAFNALLKTLEEPPEQVTFIFATTELRKVPVTVLSRCQRFDMRRVSQDVLMQHFAAIARKESVAFSEDALSLIARAADGSVRDGLSLLDQAIAQGEGEGDGGGDVGSARDSDPAQGGTQGHRIEAAMVSDMLGLADRQLVFDLFEALMQGAAEQALTLTGQAYAQGADLGLLLTDLLDLVHTISRLKAIPALRTSRDLPEAERDRGASLADRLPNAELGRAWQILLKGVQEVEQAPDRRAAAEMVLIRLCYASSLPTPERAARLVMQLSSGESSGSERPGGETSMPGGSVGSGSGNVPSGNAPSGNDRAGDPYSGAGRSGPASPGDGSPHAGQDGSGPVGRGIGGGYPGGAGPGEGTRASLRLVANGGVVCAEEASPALDRSPEPYLPDAQPRPESGRERDDPAPLRSWREMVAFVARMAEPMLHGLLRHSAHLVRFDPPQVVLRLARGTPPRTEARLQALLERIYPGQWRVVLSQEEGEPTLDEQGAEIVALRREELHAHPLLKAILEVFPDARVGEPKDLSLDEYGLPPEDLEDLASWSAEPSVPDLDFAPLDADLMEDGDWHDLDGAF